jgi:CheY-like chemotaxis protein
MSSKLRFIWIDDTPNRKIEAENMEEELKAEVQFEGLEKKDVIKELARITKEPEPDLILMDHSLSSALDNPIRTGSSAAAIIRDAWPSCPIVSITGTDIKDMDAIHRSAYEAIFSISNISKNYQRIVAIAQGFRTLKQSLPQSTQDILDLMAVPEADRGRLVKILPHELKDNFPDRSFLIELYRWCDSTLFQRPGFLYDRLWTSTLLGLSEEGFLKVEAKFEAARYKGVFATDSDDRWWKSQVLMILGEETKQYGLPWKIGRLLVGENETTLFSKCYASGADSPETVAALDETDDSDYRPMRLKCTDPHPHYEDMLFFDEMRIMRPLA